MADDADVERVEVARSGFVGGFNVFISNDTVTVLEDVRDSPRYTQEHVDGLGEFVASAEDFRIGYAKFPDFEVVYCYDRGDDYYGYAVNVDWPPGSEWGYAPFR